MGQIKTIVKGGQIFITLQTDFFLNLLCRYLTHPINRILHSLKVISTTMSIVIEKESQKKVLNKSSQRRDLLFSGAYAKEHHICIVRSQKSH